MERKIFLDKNESVFSLNRGHALSVSLENKEKMLQDGNSNIDFSLMEQYNFERDNCERYRMIFTVNPICSNVLFNTQTEVVYKEGSDDAKIIEDTYQNHLGINPSALIADNNIQNTSLLNRKQVIRDTEYSHEANGGLTYHCGLDIFNNHMLRKKNFVHVNKIQDGQGINTVNSKKYYNTINDLIRDGEGMVVTSDLRPLHNNSHQVEVPLHLYTHDTIDSMKKAYENNIKEKDGWIGFYNPSNINIENSDNKNILINNMLSNRKACEFIDMYPDRSLFSFVPKYNPYRHRLEKNWHYCITYPYRSDYKKVDEICKSHNQAIYSKVTQDVNGSNVNILYCESMFKHTLKFNDTINVYYYDANHDFKRYPTKIRVYGIGNVDGEKTNSIFSIRESDVAEIVDYLDNGLYYKKVVNGEECEYYFRIYKKLYGLDENNNRTIAINSDTNNTAFAETIYGDRTAQIVFTDDINIQNLVDNRGRKLTELYFTAIKNNAGYKLWYDENNPFSQNVEYSHCFGKLTSGLVLSNKIFRDYNIRMLHNIDTMIQPVCIRHNTYKPYLVLSNEISHKPRVIEDDINIGFEEFYGNLVEFDRVEYAETELTPVMHRFNTAQREYQKDDKYAEVTHDEMVYDDYDLDGAGNLRSFQTKEYDYASFYFNDENCYSFGNLKPEGYFYNPHTKITVNAVSDFTESVKAKFVNFSEVSGTYYTLTNETIVRMKLPSNYKLLKHDYIAFYFIGDNDNPPKTYWGEIISSDGDFIEIKYDDDVFYHGQNYIQTQIDVTHIIYDVNQERKYYPYYSSDGVPTYAVFCKSSSQFVWRPLVKKSEITYGNTLYNVPFTNGRLYIEKNINMFVRRQDPFGEFGLQYTKQSDSNIPNPMDIFTIGGDELNMESIIDFYNNLNNVCY